MSLIEVKGLTKSFGSLQVLKGLDLTVEQNVLPLSADPDAERACSCAPCACWKSRTRAAW